MSALLLTGGGAPAADLAVEDHDDTSDYLTQAPTLRREVLELALTAYRSAERSGLVRRPRLTVIDYELLSYQPRLWVLDIPSRTVIFEEWVAHGMGKPRGSGGDLQRVLGFSNSRGTRRSSLGLYVTAETYQGRHGYSLRLDGLEPGYNDAARNRSIVVHGAWYVSSGHAAKLQMGRSWGCPSVRKRVAGELIDAIKGGSVLWVYYPDPDWIAGSRFLNPE